MKHKLLLLGASLMVSLSLSAQSFTANRQKVAPEFTDWAMEEYCYLWNVGAQGFYTNHQGERVAPYWATRAVVMDELGQQVKFSRTNPGGNAEDWEGEGVLDNTCLLTSYVSVFSQEMCTFAEGWDGIWTDNNGHGNRYFNVIVKSNGYINIERNLSLPNGAGVAEEGKYLGILPTDPDKTVKLHDTEAYINEETEETYYNIDPSAEFWEDWAVVSPDAYQAWVDGGGQAAALAYAAGASLKAALEKAYAENPGINLDEPLGVYNNMSATADELKEAEASIQAIVIEWIKVNGGSPTNPGNFSSSIVNRTFDVIGDFSGWLFGDGTKQFGAGGTTAPCAEVWRGSFDAYQNINGLPEGVYMLACKGYCRYNDNHVDDYNHWKEGNISNAVLYISSESNGTFTSHIQHISESGALDVTIGGAGNNVTTIIDDVQHLLYTPNSMYEANLFFHDTDNEGNEVMTDRYDNKVYGALADGETLTIGVKNTVTSDWNLFDDFQLFYYGSSPESYQYWGQKVAEESNVRFEGCWYGAPDKEAYDAAKATLAASSDKDAVIENIAAFEEAVEKVQTSKANYAAYMAAYEEALDWLTKSEDQGIVGELVDQLADYLQADAGDVDPGVYPNGVVRDFVDPEEPGAGTLSGDEIVAETEYLNNLKSEAIRTGLVDGSDLTDLIVNPSFEESGGRGWSLDTHNGTATSGLTNWHGGNAGHYCAEAYQQKFDVYQIINDVPDGLYEVSVQAYYRSGWPADAYAAFLADPEMVNEAKVPTYVYFNDFATPVRNVMEILYHENLSNNCSEVGTDEEGNTLWALNGMASASDAFSLPDESQNFTMKVYGLVTDGKIRLGIRNLTQDGTATWSLWDNFKLTYRAKNVEALSEVIESYTLLAQEIDVEYGVPEKTALESAVTLAGNARTGDDMYDALINLVGAYNNAFESANLYEQADQLLEDLLNALEEYADIASDEALENAGTLYENEADKIGARVYSISELKDVMDQIEAAIAALKIPDISDASDDNPVDFTAVIVNPSYDDATDDGWEGSTHSHSGFNRQDMNEYYYATFDHYQTLKNLPAGTYELTLNCFNRIPGNNAQADLDAFEAGQKLEKQSAFVYAKVGDQTFAEPFRMISEAMRTDVSAVSVSYNEIESKVTLDDNNMPMHYYTPNNMQAAGAAFEEVDEFDEPLSDELNYLVRVVFTLEEEGDVVIGCKNTAGDTWAIWDNWTLTYFGTDSQKQDSGDATGVLSIENNVNVVSSEIFTVGGARVANLQRGINIVKTHMSDGTVKVQKVVVK